MSFRDLFAGILSWLKLADTAVKHIISWALNHIWVLIFPFVAVFKLVFDLLRTLSDKLVSAFSAIQLSGMFQYNGSTASFGDLMAFFNSFIPLDELMVAGMGLFVFWMACLLIRTIKGIKQTILF